MLMPCQMSLQFRKTFLLQLCYCAICYQLFVLVAPDVIMYSTDSHAFVINPRLLYFVFYTSFTKRLLEGELTYAVIGMEQFILIFLKKFNAGKLLIHYFYKNCLLNVSSHFTPSTFYNKSPLANPQMCVLIPVIFAVFFAPVFCENCTRD
jgi:hypothetical protein